MKITIFALIALAIGITIGTYSSWREFKDERLPTRSMLELLTERETNIPTEGPKVIVEGGEVFDFGTKDRGSSGHHDFVFRNVGTRPLVLTLGETTCTCTAMSVGGKPMVKGDKQTLLPGKSFKVTLEWLVKKAQPDYSQSAEFTTTDPRRQVVRLLIHGRTVEAMELEHPSLEIASVTANETAVGEMALYSHREEELKILKHTWRNTESKQFFTATFLPADRSAAVARGAKGGLLLRVTVKPGLPLGTTKQVLTLYPNYEGIEPQVIPVSIRIVGDISLLGPKVPDGSTTVALGNVEQSVGRTHTVYLHIKGPHREMTNVEMESIEPAGSLTATLEPAVAISPTVKRIPINITVPAGAPIGNYLGTSNNITGRITLKTTHPNIKQITIPVLFLVR